MNNTVERMQHLMGVCEDQKETPRKDVDLVLFREGADGKTYAIIKEGGRYMVKVTEGKDIHLVESYQYIGGLENKSKNSYSGYKKATIALEGRLFELNHGAGKVATTAIHDVPRVGEHMKSLLSEGSEEMRNEIERYNRITENATKIFLGENIDPQNRGLPEAPKTQEFNVSVGTPFEEPAKADLDKDFTKQSTDPTKEGYEDLGNDKDAELEKAEYVPNNSVADKEPKGNEPVKVKNEEIKEGIENVVGFGEDGGEEGEMLSDEDFAQFVASQLEGGVTADEFYGEQTPDEEGVFEEGCKAKKINEEAGEQEEDGVKFYQAKTQKWFNERNLSVFSNFFVNTLVGGLKSLRGETDSNVIVEKSRELDSAAQKLKSLIQKIREGKELNAKPETIEAYNQQVIGNDKNVDLLLTLVEDIRENISSVEDSALIELEGGESKFRKDNDDWNKRKATELGYDSSEDEEGGEIDSRGTKKMMNRLSQTPKDSEADFSEKIYQKLGGNMKESVDRVVNGVINQLVAEGVVLDDFGKHPAYRKKPMTLPKADGEEEPYGKKIGDSFPYNKQVLVDTVMKKLEESGILKKKN